MQQDSQINKKEVALQREDGKVPSNSQIKKNQFFIKNIQSKTQSQRYSREIELINGEVISLNGFSSKDQLDNTLRFNLMTIKNFILVIFSNFFTRVGNVLSSITYLIIVLCPSYYLEEANRISFQQESYHLIYLFTILLTFIGQTLMEGYFDCLRYTKSQELNNNPATILERFTNFNYFLKQNNKQESISIYKQIKSKDVQIGDIVFVRKNEIFPADIIILDIYNSYCSSNNSYSCGKTTQNKIYPIPITHIPKFSKIKGNHFEYKKILTGKIEYVSPAERNAKFEGFIKVSKDPVGTVVAKEHIGLRGSMLEYSDWVIGIAIYTGKECFYYQDTNQHWLQLKDKKPLSYFNLKKEKYFALYFFLFIFCCLVSVIRTHLNTCFDDLPKYNSQGNPSIDQQSFYIGLGYFCDYMLFLPSIYYFFCDITELISALVANNSFETQSEKLLKTDNQSQSEIPPVNVLEKVSLKKIYLERIRKFFQDDIYFLKNSSKPIEDLSLITDCFIDKTGTLTKGRSFEIDRITLQETQYLISENFNDPIKIQKFVSVDYTVNDQSYKQSSRKESMSNKKANRQIITVITNEATNDQNDIAGEEGVFLRHEIPQAYQVKQKIQVEAKNNHEDKRVKQDTLEERNKEDEEEVEKEEQDKIMADTQNEKAIQFSESPTKVIGNDFLKAQQKLIKFQAGFDDQNFKIESKSIEESQDIGELKVNNKLNSFINSSQNLVHGYQTQKIKDFKTLETSKSLETEQFLFKRKLTLATNQFMFTQQNDSRFYEEIQSNSQSYSSQKEAILAMIICHISKSTINKKTNNLYTDHQSIYDNLFISFAKRFECKFRCVSHLLNGNIQYFSTLGKKVYQHRFFIPSVYNEKGNRLQLLVQCEEHYYIYVREEINSLPTYIRNIKQMKEKYQGHIQNMTENGQIGIIFSRKLITPFLAQQMIEKYQEIKQIIDYSQLHKLTEQIYREQLYDMDVVSMVSIKEKLNDGSLELIQNLKKSSINIWMLTGDDYIRAITTAYNSQIIKKSDKNEIIHFNSVADEEINYLIQSSLSKVKHSLESDGQQIFTKQKEIIKQITGSQVCEKPEEKQQTKTNSTSQSNKFYMVVNGEALTKILSNQHFKDHFLFLTFFCESFIGYSLCSQQKSDLVSIKKNLDPSKIYTLAIGDGLNDIQMMRQADYSIQYMDLKSQSIQYFHGLSELSVQKIGDINKLIFQISRQKSKNFEHLLVFTFYRQTFILSSVFFWNFMQCSYGDLIYNKNEILLINSICFFVDFLLLYFQKDRFDQKERLKCMVEIQKEHRNILKPSSCSIQNSQRLQNNFQVEDTLLYKHNKQIVTYDVVKNFFLNILPTAIMGGMILFCVPYYSLGLVSNDLGIIFERNEVIYIFIVMFVFKMQIGIFIFFENEKRIGLCQLAYVLIFALTYYSANYYDLDLNQFISSNLLLSYFLILLLFVMYSLLYKVFFPIIKMEIQKNFKKQDISETSSIQKEYAVESYYEHDRSEVIKDTTEQISSMSPEKLIFDMQQANVSNQKAVEDNNIISPKQNIYSSPQQLKKKRLNLEIPKLYNNGCMTSRRNSIENNSNFNLIKAQKVENSSNNSPNRDQVAAGQFQFSDRKGDSVNEFQVNSGNDFLLNLKQVTTNNNDNNLVNIQNEIVDQNSTEINNKRFSHQSIQGELERNTINFQDINFSSLQRRKFTEERLKQFEEMSTRKNSLLKNANLNKQEVKKANSGTKLENQNESFDNQIKSMQKHLAIPNNLNSPIMLVEVNNSCLNDQKSQNSQGMTNAKNFQKKQKLLMQQNRTVKTNQRNAIRLALQNKFFFKGYEINDIVRMVFQGRDTDKIVMEINPKNYNDYSYRIKNIFFKFDRESIEKQFQKQVVNEWKHFSRISTLMFSIICELALAQFMISINNYSFGFNTLSVCFGIQFLLWGFMFTPIYEQSFFLINTLQLLVRVFSRSILILCDFNYNITILQGLFYSSIIQYSIVMSPPIQLTTQLFLSVTQCIVYTIRYQDSIISHSSDSYLDIYIILQTYCFFISFTLFIFYQNCTYQIAMRKNFEKINKLQDESNKMNDVLSILLPKFIRENIQEKGLSYQEDQGEVAILFCDICDFDSVIEQEKKNVIKLLDKLFRIYDESCSNYGLQKIETVGKTYMAAGGLKGIPPVKKYLINNESIHQVTNSVLMAYDMYENAKKITYGNKNTKLNVKIGIHYGRVMAGVIGGHKPQFSLIGDTVNMASRVCSTGAADSVTLSAEAKAQCFKQIEFLNKNQQYFNLKYKILLVEKKVEAKGKGVIQTFQIVFQRDTKRHLSRFYNIEQERPVSSSNNLEQGNNSLAISTNLTNQQTKQEFDQQQQQQHQRLGIFSKVNSAFPSFQDSQFQIVASSLLKKGKHKNETPKKVIPNGNTQNHTEVNQIQSQEYGGKPQSVFNNAQDTYLKIMGTNLGVAPNIEYQFEINNETIDIERIQQNFNEIENELSTIQNNHKQIINKISFLDLLAGKYNNEFWIFQMEKIMNSNRTMKQRGQILLIFEIVKLVMVNLMNQYLGSQGSMISLILHMLSITMLIIMTFGYQRIIKLGVKYVKLFIFTCFLLIIGAMVYEGYAFVKQEQNQFFTETQTSAVIIVFSMFLSIKFYSILEKIIYSCALILMYLLFSFNNNIAKIEYCYTTIAIILTQLFNSFQQLELNITSFQNRKQLDAKVSEQNKLLKYLLPSHIRDRFLQNQAKTINLIDNFDNVTILYADIAGFTKYSASVRPENVVFMLRELFTKFDQKCQENDVFKLYTIGDCYVVMGLVNVENRDYAKEALNVIKMGFCMIDIIQQVRAVVNFDELEMRIGIHTGSIIGGVVGTGVVRYDIYGPDVVIANKMESNGESGRVMISETTYNLVNDICQGEYEFEQARVVNIPTYQKNIKGYLVKKTQREDSNYSLKYLQNGEDANNDQ
ncbi:hypothetical protein ABPG72_006669 [Tetrahymena utriculariae]